jgi:hypothetical protein
MAQDQDAYEERQAIINAQQQAQAAQIGAAELFRQQVDTLIRTLQVDEWGAFQEFRQEQMQNALEYERMQQQQALER